MSASQYMQIGLYFAALIALTPLLGSYMARVFVGEKTFVTSMFGPVERALYRIGFIDYTEEMDWKKYAGAVLWFSVVGLIATTAVQMLQSDLPLNPQNLPNVSWALAFNTAASFVTNTNWQAYSGENTLSYFSQAAALTVQNFLSAAVGIAVLLAFIRGLVRKNVNTIGNFWVDMTRSTLYVLIPLSIVVALILVSQGVIQNISAYVEATTLEGAKQLLPMGPAASQVAIKQLGTNGGGFFGANSAHPFENPTPLSNFIEMLAILLIPSALVYMFGIMTNARRHALVLYCVMMGVMLVCLSVGLWSEYLPNHSLGLAHQLEGKELRFGITNSVLWSITTTAASNGSVNAMLDSVSPLTGCMAMFQLLLGEIIFGGVGSGLYGILLHVLLTVFLAGLMVGRTPEYLGKKIEAREMKLVLIAILLPSAAVLIGAGVSCVLPIALAGLANQGPHGLSEILYAFASTANNNGSAFGGLNVNTNYYNVLLALAMLIGRFGVIFPILAIAGGLAQKKSAPASLATFSTDSLTFSFLLTGVILIVAALTFLPALSLGPIVEHFLMQSGQTF